PFLRDIRECIGDLDVRSLSDANGRGGRSSSTSLRKEQIWDVAELRAIPKWRALMFSSGNPATYLQLDPWWTQDYASSVEASKEYYENAGVKACVRPSNHTWRVEMGK